MRDLQLQRLPMILHQFVCIWRLVSQEGIDILPCAQDSIRWILSSDGIYSAKSAYDIQFAGRIRSLASGCVWKVWAPPKCKILGWLLLHDRVWCADRLQRRGWPNCYLCQLCNRSLESSWHLMFECPYARHIWTSVAQWPNCSALEPCRWMHAQSLGEIWMIMDQATPSTHRRGFRSLFLLIC